MNITGYRKHLKEMKFLLNKEKSKQESFQRNKRINSLEKNIPSCLEKIKILKKEALKKRSQVARKSIKRRKTKGRRRMFAKKKK